MSTTSTSTRTSSASREGLQARWGKFVNALRPAPNPDRLVRVAKVSRHAQALAEGSLADVGMTPVFQELPSATGDSQFAILVAAKDADLAESVLQGL